MDLEAVKSGDLRRSLEAQRDDLARRLDETAGDREAAALHRQLTIVLDKIDKLPSGREESSLDRIASNVDELTARRESRASGQDRSTG